MINPLLLEPPRPKPRRCFFNVYYYAASDSVVLDFNFGGIYIMPGPTLLTFGFIKTNSPGGVWYNENVRHAMHAAKTRKLPAVPPGWTASLF
jgi:hypothetical protein